MTLLTTLEQQPTHVMRGIPASLIEAMWHYAIPYVKRALDYTSGELDHEDFKTLCLNRDVQLWLVNNVASGRVVAAVTTEIVSYPRRKHCRVITLGGSGFAEWIELVDKTLVEFARSMECSALETYVRRGLVPKLAPLNYLHKHSILVKELT